MQHSVSIKDLSLSFGHVKVLESLDLEDLESDEGDDDK